MGREDLLKVGYNMLSAEGLMLLLWMIQGLCFLIVLNGMFLVPLASRRFSDDFLVSIKDQTFFILVEFDKLFRYVERRTGRLAS